MSNQPPRSLPVSRLQLIQIGQWKAPRSDFDTKIGVEVKEAITEMYRAPVYDHDRNRRADLNPLRVTHEGAYSCCGFPRVCNWAMSEWDGIVRSVGVAKTPMLFHRYPYCADCPDDCVCDSLYHGAPCYACIRKNLCGEWMWAWGTVTKITNDLSAEDFRSPKTATASLEIRLEGPLQLVSHTRWLVAPKLEITQPCQTIEDAAALVDYSRKTFAPPCGPGDCCARVRFWPRDLNTICPDCLDCDIEFDPRFWEAKYVPWVIQNDTCFNLFVPGHVPPRVQAILSSGAGSVTIRNAVGTQTIAYGTTGAIYSDTATGLVWRDSGSGYALLAGALDLLTLEPGENIITTTTTSLTLGFTPYWVN